MSHFRPEPQLRPAVPPARAAAPASRRTTAIAPATALTAAIVCLIALCPVPAARADGEVAAAPPEGAAITEPAATPPAGGQADPGPSAAADPVPAPNPVLAPAPNPAPAATDPAGDVATTTATENGTGQHGESTGSGEPGGGAAGAGHSSEAPSTQAASHGASAGRPSSPVAVPGELLGAGIDGTALWATGPGLLPIGLEGEVVETGGSAPGGWSAGVLGCGFGACLGRGILDTGALDAQHSKNRLEAQTRAHGDAPRASGLPWSPLPGGPGLFNLFGGGGNGGATVMLFALLAVLGAALRLTRDWTVQLRMPEASWPSPAYVPPIESPG